MRCLLLPILESPIEWQLCSGRSHTAPRGDLTRSVTMPSGWTQGRVRPAPQASANDPLRI